MSARLPDDVRSVFASMGAPPPPPPPETPPRVPRSTQVLPPLNQDEPLSRNLAEAVYTYARTRPRREAPARGRWGRPEADPMGFLPTFSRGVEVMTASDREVTAAVGEWNTQVRDRNHAVVPVGLVPAYELARRYEQVMLTICGHLQRVMDATAPAWDGETWASMPDEPDVLPAWRSLMGSLAANSAPVQDRRAVLDMEAYAVEAEQHALGLARLPDAFRAFVDALADHYADHFRARDTPVFVFAVTEVDPRTEPAIRLAMKALRHERIVYLLGS